MAADAACTRLASSVNDFGKVGPARDAQALLDKQIVDNMAKRGVKTYNVGKKDVACTLFLDVGVFDEYTCKASATVCWGGSNAATPVVEAAAGAPVTTGSTSKAPVAKKEPAPAQKIQAKKKADPA